MLSILRFLFRHGGIIHSTAGGRVEMVNRGYARSKLPEGRRI
jgi:hypothetical protein